MVRLILIVDREVSMYLGEPTDDLNIVDWLRTEWQLDSFVTLFE